MGLANDLSYVHRRPNAGQRCVQALAATRPGAWVFSKTLPALDRGTDRLTTGRVSLPLTLAGLPTLVVTTTGRKSGKVRPAHLIAVPFADTLALLGTNFGQASTPAWVLNLEATPRATVTYRGSSREVLARLATDGETARVLADSAHVYVGYQKYQRRIAGRRLRVFILELAAD